MEIFWKTLKDLEWEKILDSLAARAITGPGAEKCKTLDFYNSEEEIKDSMCLIKEATELVRNDQLVPLFGLELIDEYTKRADKQGVLDSSAIIKIGESANISKKVRSFFKRNIEHCPGLWKIAESLIPMPDFVDEINRCFGESEELLDRASHELKDKRQTVRKLQESTKSKLQKLITKKVSKYLMDEYYTLRNGRYVLPVRSESRGYVKGFIHGSSGSGATIFIEPTELVEEGNALRLAEAEVAEEEYRILGQLTAMVQKASGALVANIKILLEIDLIWAKTTLSEDLQTNPPDFENNDEIDLRKARHPLMVLNGINVIPNNIILPKDSTIMVISGPNTGGKTVTMKTLGINCLMLRIGMPILAAPGSKLPIFNNIFTVLGDEQDMTNDISTFSGHLLQIKELLSKADNKCLALIDEITADTDPFQGAALATAILEQLTERNIKTLVTTHYEQLKALASKSKSYLNASMGFDIENMKPTYYLNIGTPGSSKPLELALRLGFHKNIIKRAEINLDPSQVRFEKLLKELEFLKTQLLVEKTDLENSIIQVEKRSEQLDIKEKKFRKKEQETVLKERENLLKEVEEIRNEVTVFINKLRSKGNMKLAVETSKHLKDVTKKQRTKILSKKEESIKKAHGRNIADYDVIKKGRVLFHIGLNKEVKVLSDEKNNRTNNEIFVSAGGLKIRSKKTELLIPDKITELKKPERKKYLNDDYGINSESMIRTKQNSLDIRGLRVDEAILELDKFLDAALLKRFSAVYILHGHGTGALKEAVRHHLGELNFVSSFRRGKREEGGDGITVVFF